MNEGIIEMEHRLKKKTIHKKSYNELRETVTVFYHV